MKLTVSKSLLILPLCITFAGCSQSEDTKETDIYDTLSALSESHTTSSVQAAFNQILDATASYYENAFQIQQKVLETNPVYTEELDVETNSQWTVQSQWLSDNVLYQVIRAQEVLGQPAYGGIYRMDADKTTQVSLNLSSGDVFDEDAVFTIQYISELDNNALKDESEDQVRYHLLGEELQPLTDFLGSSAVVPPYSSPDLFEFTVSENDGDTLTFAITLSDIDGYNKAADDAVDRTDLLSNGIVIAQSYETTAAAWTLTLDKDGAILEAKSSMEENFTWNDTTYDLNSDRQIWLTGIASNQDVGYLEDVFQEIDGGTLRRGSTLQVELGVKDPQNFD